MLSVRFSTGEDVKETSVTRDTIPGIKTSLPYTNQADTLQLRLLIDSLRRELGDHSSQVSSLLDSIRSLRQPRRATSITNITEYKLDSVADTASRALNRVTDSIAAMEKLLLTRVDSFKVQAERRFDRVNKRITGMMPDSLNLPYTDVKLADTLVGDF